MECRLQSPPRSSHPIRKRFTSGSHSALTSVQGFFRSLFTAGFSESLPRLHTHQSGPDEIDLVFDDRNITRAGQFHSFDCRPIVLMPSLSIRVGAPHTFFYSLTLNRFAESVYPGCMAVDPYYISLLALYRAQRNLCPHPFTTASLGAKGQIINTQHLLGFSFHCWQLPRSYPFLRSQPKRFLVY
jgi:hypothetical protein